MAERPATHLLLVKEAQEGGSRSLLLREAARDLVNNVRLARLKLGVHSSEALQPLELRVPSLCLCASEQRDSATRMDCARETGGRTWFERKPKRVSAISSSLLRCRAVA